jgi:MoaA/NifB/PqqE/SkfB family radical SAM enzyme
MRERAANVPAVVEWHSTQRCNLRCSHCGPASGRPLPDELDTAEALRLISQLELFGVRQLSISGGELATRHDWQELLEHAVGRFEWVQLTTNGWAADELVPALDRIGRRGRLIVQLSLDGDEAVHDRRRGRGSYARALSVLRGLPELDRDLITTVARDNSDERVLDHVLGVCLDHGVQHWTVQPALPIGRLAPADSLGQRGFALVAEYVRSRQPRATGRLRVRAPSLADVLPVRGRNELRVLADGSVSGCLMRPEERHGNVRQHSLEQIWQSGQPPESCPGCGAQCEALERVFASDPSSTAARAAPRLLLIEFLTTDRFCQYRSEMFPFVRGLAEARGIPLRWLAYGFEPRELPTSPLLMALSERDTERLCAAIRAHAPTHVLSNEQLDEPLARRVRGAAAGAKLDVVTAVGKTWPEIWYLRDLERWLDLAPASSDAGELIVDHVVPNHACELDNELARRIKPFTQVVAGTPCVYVPPLARNPYFFQIDLSHANRRTGCSFCTGGEASYFEGRFSPLESALSQIRRARATVPPERSHGQYAIVGVHVLLQIGQFFETILAEEFPASDFFFWSRIDELNSRAGQIDALLPRLRQAGHSLNFWNVGVENFSAEENLRFNKGLDPGQIERFIGLVERWERDYPDTFRFREWGGFGFILFTPWTTLDDLRVNLAMAERCKVDRSSIFFMSRLQLFENLPIQLLAERDGLVSDAFDDPIFGEFCAFVAVVNAEQREIPWRFQHPVLAAVYGIFIRLNKPWKRDLFETDQSYQRVSDMLSYRLPPEHRDVYRFLELVLTQAGAHPETRTPAELLDLVEAQLPLAPVRAAQAGEQADDGDGPDPLRDVRLELRDRLSRVLARLEAHPERPLRGWHCTSVRDRRQTIGWGRLDVALRRGDVELRLLIEPRSDRPAFLRTRHFSFVYGREMPADTAEKQALIALIARAFES